MKNDLTTRNHFSPKFEQTALHLLHDLIRLDYTKLIYIFNQVYNMCLFSPRKNLNLVSGDSPPKELTDKSSATFVSVVSDLSSTICFYFPVCCFAFVCCSVQGLFMWRTES